MRQEKEMSQLDAEGYFVCPTMGEESPLEPGVYLLPAGAVDAPVPQIPEGKKAKWEGKWVFEDIPKPEPEPEPEPTPPTDEEIKNKIITDTQNRLDKFAQTRNYYGILSLCTYATSTNPKFASEGKHGVEARDDTWATLYGIYEEVKAGTRPMPADYDAIKADLPVLEWPDA